METVWAYITSEQFITVTLVGLGFLLFMALADLLELHNRADSVQQAGREKPPADSPGSASIP